ncbi:unnamed protein product, partial [Echinostoma caproni]|uniref:DH domain-containing protein n=1 Tax=Echinostoma caproni TaxID=27848 RepID=A0A183A9T3_9TREM
MRIPFGLVVEPYNSDIQGSPLQQYLDELTIAERRHFEQAKLETALQCLVNDNALCGSPDGVTSKTGGSVLPGQPLSDLQHVVDSIQPTILGEELIAQVYKTFQAGLRARAREEFLDLLLERTDLFLIAAHICVRQLCDSFSREGTSPTESCILSLPDLSSRTVMGDLWEVTSRSTGLGGPMGFGVPDRHGDSSILTAPPRGLKETHLHWLELQLSQDERYRAMMFLPSERQTLVASYFNTLLPFFTETVQHPGSSSNSRNCGTEIRFPEASHTSSSWLPTHSCPSTSWGGCMDQLLKWLAYQKLPINPRCLEPGVPAFRHELSEKSDSCPATCINGTSGRSHLPCLDSRDVPGPRKTTLSVGVACVCSDTLAAQAVIHLFGCAGFSMTSLLPHPASVQSAECDSGHTKPEDTQSLNLSSSWPLSTSRLPPVQLACPQTNSPSTTNLTCSTSKATQWTCGNQVADGQVCASLMSVHKMLRDLVSFGVETSNSDNLGATTELPLNSDTSVFPHGKLHHGYIFVLSETPHDDFPVPWFNPSDFTSYSTSPTNPSDAPDTPLSGLENGRQSRNALRRMNSIDTEDGTDADENVLTPRPDLDQSFFEQDISSVPIEPKQSPKWDPSADPNVDNQRQPPCLCCTLLRDEHHPETDCVCGHCCTCVHAGLINQVKVPPASCSSTSYGTPCDTRSSTGGFTQRSWPARLAAVRSAISLLPSHVPHLVLLTREASDNTNGELSAGVLDGMVNLSKDSGPETVNTNNAAKLPNTTLTAPLMFAAPSSLCAPSGRFSCAKSDLTSDSAASRQGEDKSRAHSPLDSTTDETDEVSDWMQEGTHVLDHVIRFLNLCWEKSESFKNGGLSDRVHQIQSRSATCQCFGASCASVSVSQKRKANARIIGQPSALDKTSNSAKSVEKQSNNSLFHSLSAASATGRRAVHTANQTLKKLSVSARKQQKHTTGLSGSIFTVGNMSKLQSNANAALMWRNSAHGKSLSTATNVTQLKLSKRIAANDSSSRQPAQRPTSLKSPETMVAISRCAPVSWALGSFSPDSTDERSVIPRTASSELIGKVESPPVSPTNSPLVKSSLRASVDHGSSAIQHSFMSAGIVARSRCSVPDCTMLVSSEEYRRMIGTSVSSSLPIPCAISDSSSPCRPHSSVLAESVTSGTWNTVSSAGHNLRHDSPAFHDRLETIGLKDVSPKNSSLDPKGADTGESICDTSTTCLGDSVSRPTVVVENNKILADELSRDIPCVQSLPSPLCARLTKNSGSIPTDSTRPTDDVESIYMDLDLLTSQTKGSTISESAGVDVVPPHHPSNHQLLGVSTDTEDHIYQDPLDFLSPAQFERIHCMGSHRPGFLNVPISSSTYARSVSGEEQLSWCVCEREREVINEIMEVVNEAHSVNSGEFEGKPVGQSAYMLTGECHMPLYSIFRRRSVSRPGRTNLMQRSITSASPMDYSSASTPHLLIQTGPNDNSSTLESNGSQFDSYPKTMPTNSSFIAALSALNSNLSRTLNGNSVGGTPTKSSTGGTPKRGKFKSVTVSGDLSNSRFTKVFSRGRPTGQSLGHNPVSKTQMNDVASPVPDTKSAVEAQDDRSSTLVRRSSAQPTATGDVVRASVSSKFSTPTSSPRHMTEQQKTTPSRAGVKPSDAPMVDPFTQSTGRTRMRVVLGQTPRVNTVSTTGCISPQPGNVVSATQSPISASSISSTLRELASPTSLPSPSVSPTADGRSQAFPNSGPVDSLVTIPTTTIPEELPKSTVSSLSLSTNGSTPLTKPIGE